MQMPIDCFEVFEYIDTHTHTRSWTPAHFACLSSKIFLLSLQYNSRLNPEELRSEVESHQDMPNIQFAFGIHPQVHFTSVSEAERILDELEKLIEAGHITLLGEIGFNDSRDVLGVNVLRRQLSLVRKHAIPAIIHTPTRVSLGGAGDLQTAVLTVRDLLIQIRPDPELIVIDHVNATKIEIFADLGVYLGLTLQPRYGKLGFNEAAQLVTKYPSLSDRFLVNSDVSNVPGREEAPESVNRVRDFAQQVSGLLGTNVVRQITYWNAGRFLKKAISMRSQDPISDHTRKDLTWDSEDDRWFLQVLRHHSRGLNYAARNDFPNALDTLFSPPISNVPRTAWAFTRNISASRSR